MDAHPIRRATHPHHIHGAKITGHPNAEQVNRKVVSSKRITIFVGSAREEMDRELQEYTLSSSHRAALSYSTLAGMRQDGTYWLPAHS